jgi:iron(III) transport system ATP-binding protein
MFLSAVRSLGRRPAIIQAGAAAEAVVVRGIEKSFGSAEVLKKVSLTVPAGSLVALLGPSGCGKTTLLRTIAGLERPSAGSIEVGSRTVVDGTKSFVPPERRRIGMVFQDWALFPHLSVRGNVAFGLPRSERRSRRVDDALRLVDLTNLAERMPGTLSGGQQQRVALARALANRPSVILLDEPFSNLDAALRHQIRAEVQVLLRDLGVTALFVTHDQEEAFTLGEWIAVMFDGEIVQQCRPSELYEMPATRRVAEFIGDANFLPGDATGITASTFLGRIPIRGEHDGTVEIMLRPEDVLVRPGDSATVTSLEFYGHDAVYLLRTDTGVELRSRVLAAPEFRVGDRVGLEHSGRPAMAYRPGA